MRWHDVTQNSEAWESLRLGKVTGSNFSRIMANEGKAFGDPAKTLALEIALERATGKRPEHGYSNQHMERGHAQEPMARMLYEQEHFTTVGNGGFFDCGDYGASPDGLVDDDGVIEIKSVIPKMHYANLRRDAPDPTYKWQYVGHLDCTGRKWVDCISYCAGFPEHLRLIVHRIHRSDVTAELGRLKRRRAEFIKLIETTYDNIMEAAQCPAH